ncbi:hypothetical protein Poli38472_010213 [Pythium oligandrum]|uniref:Uncharacterized protein n=1 Tax=Pythium oligandrum TaxID=41045 RepID=A0A8K1C8Y0_PYTOL|nr:hypothetical protein Poli38472_010213 [Pythium oligandrum]|eukprot:TMW58654.1 hypothetical protein Poli38472_010213 [Pythium oligandrum]
MASPPPSKRLRLDSHAHRASDEMKLLTQEPACAALRVLGDATLLRQVTSFLDGLPVLFIEMAHKKGITAERIQSTRSKARKALALPERSPFEFEVTAEKRDLLVELRKTHMSYMEMGIQEGNLRVLELVYTLHKQGIEEKHPRFGFRKPMRHAAAYGQLEMLEWLSEQEEKQTWLKDPWLVDAALASCRLSVVQWVHENYCGSEPVVVRTRSLDAVASRGELELLRWALSTFPDTELTIDAMDGAAANGDSEMVRYLHEERTEGCTTRAMDKAAANGHLSMVEFLHDNRTEGCTTQAMNEAASNGHLDVVKFFHENRKEGCTEKAMNGAATSGHLEILRFLHANRSEGCTEVAMNEAIKNGHLDVVRFLHEQRCCGGNWWHATRVAVARNHMPVVRFVCEYHSEDLSASALEEATSDNMLEMIKIFEECKVDGWSTGIMDHAVAIGSLDALQHLHLNRDEGCSMHAMDKAAGNGHLNTLRFLHEHRSEGCTKRAMNAAAASGNLDILRFLQENRTEGCTSKALVHAVMAGGIDVIKFLLNHYDLDCPAIAVTKAAERGEWELLELVLQLNPPDTLDQVSVTLAAGGHIAVFERLCGGARVERTAVEESIEKAVQNGHWYMVKYLLSQIRGVERRSFTTVKCLSDAVRTAAHFGDFDMVRLLTPFVSHRFDGDSAHYLINAVMIGDLDLLAFLRQKRRSAAMALEDDSDDDGDDDSDDDMVDNSSFEGTRFNGFSVQIVTAAVHGHLEIVRWLTGNRPVHDVILTRAASSAGIDVVRFLRGLVQERESSFLGLVDSLVGNDAMSEAARHGNLAVLKYLHSSQSESELPEGVFEAALDSDFLDTVKFAYENSNEQDTQGHSIDIPVRQGNFDIVRFLQEHTQVTCSTNVLNAVATKNALTLVRHLHEHQPEKISSCALANAAARGHVEMVKLLFDHRNEGRTDNAMDFAAGHGYLEIVRFLHTHRSEGCTTRAMDEAAEKGYLHVVKFLHHHRHEGCTIDAMDMAVCDGHVSIVKFLHENRNEGCTKFALDTAIRIGHLTLAKFLHQNRQEGFHEAALERAIEGDPEDTSLVQQWLAADVVKNARSRREFLKKRKFERLLKRGRFALNKQSQGDDEASEEYDSSEDVEHWSDVANNYNTFQ